ncbi:hypothetical protein [Wenjunlia vitaminophila]|uniref:hypothetical protein n=1 Tax=Wenjunlia vitaminophila TaxID=76728 RepID=UPI0003742B18|nr:hypothetical protein [Wenjunlia vitaminophila]
MRIPGLGCLKGCFTVLVVLSLVVLLAWTVGPLDDWVSDGRSFWQTTRDWVENSWDWVNDLTSGSDSGGGGGGAGETNLPNTELPEGKLPDLGDLPDVQR